MDPAIDLPAYPDVELAARRIAPHAVRTPVLSNAALDALAGATLRFKCENLQHVGAFKFRGACNAVFSLSEAEAARGVATQSSGNHGAALAAAARLRGIAAHVVVPEGAPAIKLRNIERAGARIVRCAPNMAARDAATAKVVAETGATLVHPFDDARVIAGQGTAALELLDDAGPLDDLIAPVGGGGLLSGCAIAAQGRDAGIAIHGAEPEGARDAHDSLAQGVRITDRIADTVADGLRGYLGVRGFAVLRERCSGILLVDDAGIVAAMRLLFEHLKLVVEPSGAVALAALLRHRERFRGRSVGVILSGGNVDLDRLPWQAP
ncbi:MAG TPA: pyridoxal-phosphate dependent enzyme [Xanthomonadales bacterium]|nr:pyridoxal-phosphate dependent enzyme [Xanthomonadales bacterium]